MVRYDRMIGSSTDDKLIRMVLQQPETGVYAA